MGSRVFEEAGVEFPTFSTTCVVVLKTLALSCQRVIMKLCNKFERNRAIRGGVIAISVFDLMTLNSALCAALVSWIIFTKFDLRQLIRA